MSRAHRDGFRFSFVSLASSSASAPLTLKSLIHWQRGLAAGVLVLLAGCSMPPRPAPVAETVPTVAAGRDAYTPAPSSTPPIPAAPAAAPVAASAPAASTLGTQWGEGRESSVELVDATRITPARPQALKTLHYTDEASIRSALGARADRQLNVLLADGKVEWSLRDENDRPLPIYGTRGEQGARQVAGSRGARYELVYVNRSQRSYEVVATVDGLDVLTGQSGSLRNNGYLLMPGETLRIEGFRKSSNEVAAFRFSGKDGAYASNTPAGNPRNIGVIGTALFEVRLDKGTQPPSGGHSRGDRPNAFPADKPSPSPYAPAPQYR